VKIAELFSRAAESFEAKVVYGEPVEKDGVTLIPAAKLVGGGGGGNGADEKGQRGEGGGLGLVARPVGAFVIKDGRVWWQPAIDVNRLIATIGSIAIAGLFVGARLLKQRAKASK
jgi:uncharacterized spore protein YtfJ